MAVSDIHIDKRKRREGERIKKEAEYKAWQNKYSADIPSNMKGMLTKEDYVENRRINGIKNRPSGIDKDIWEQQYQTQDFQETAENEYREDRVRVALDGDKMGIKRYFGLDVSDEVASGDFSALTEGQLQDPKVIEFIEFHKNIQQEEKDNYDQVNTYREANKTGPVE